ncbi:MAG: nucleoside deaminase [Alphaproteobacteria bacterium]|mgnify:CR=1 FL=1
MDEFMAAAFAEAKASFDEGGQPIGAVLVMDGIILGRGRNTLAQSGDATSHAEMEAYRDASRRAAKTNEPDKIDGLLRGGTVYTTMMPCIMCSGAIIRFGAARVVVAETTSYGKADTLALMEGHGIEVELRHESECVDLVEAYYRLHPEMRAAWSADRT